MSINGAYGKPGNGNAGHSKAWRNTYQRRRQYIYIYNHCQLSRVAPGHAVLVSVCVFLLPLLAQLPTEHVQTTTMYHLSKQWYVYPCHITFRHTSLVIPSVNNALQAMVLQNRLERSNIGSSSHTSSHSSDPPSPCLNLPSAMGRSAVMIVAVLLLLLSGDIETNPGPVGKLEFLY